MEIEPASARYASLKTKTMDKVPKEKTVSVKFICALSLLFIHDNLAMKDLVWLRMVWFGASYTNLR
jgi:hypothetical protein